MLLVSSSQFAGILFTLATLVATDPAHAAYQCRDLLRQKLELWTQPVDIEPFEHLPGRRIEGNPRLEIRLPGPKRQIQDISELTFVNLNVFNLVEYKGKVVFNSGRGQRELISNPTAKPGWALDQIAERLIDTNADFITLEEVESQPALNQLLERLRGKYQGHLIEGIDVRGIDVAILVRSDLPFDMSIQSHRTLWARNAEGSPTPVFSRDLPVLEVRLPAQQTPLFVLAATHFKSQRDGPNDPKSVKRRTLQVRAAVEVLNHYQTPFQIIQGDFNADIRSAPEFNPLWENGMRDALDVANVPEAQRVTHSFFGNNGERNYSQLDGMVVSGPIWRSNALVAAEVLPWLDQSRFPKPLPRNYSDRKRDPSDHRATKWVLDFRRLLEPRLQK